MKVTVYKAAQITSLSREMIYRYIRMGMPHEYVKRGLKSVLMVDVADVLNMITNKGENNNE